VLVLLLEWRAALVVQDLVHHEANPDASATQRVSKAATEAFVAVQVGQMIQELQFSDKEKCVVADLYRLVSN
jgi:acyl-CoA oxidase